MSTWRKAFDKAARQQPGAPNILTTTEEEALRHAIAKEHEGNGLRRRVRKWLAATGQLPPEMRGAR